MGYCFQLRLHDPSGNALECYEYTGSFGLGTIEGFLNNLRILCNELWCPLPEDVLQFMFNQTYNVVECAEILECLESLKVALEEGTVEWQNDDRQSIFEEFLKLFKKAVATQGYIKQTFSY